MNKFIGFLTGGVLGGLISAATVLLLTPKSGNAVRADIKHDVDTILAEGQRAMDTRRQEMESQLAEMRGDATKPDLRQ